MWSRRGSIGVAVALACTAAAGPARAEAVAPSPASPPAPAPEARTFPVEIEGSRPGLDIRVTGEALDVPCGEHCALEIPKGRYMVQVRSPDGRTSVKDLSIRKPARLTVTPLNHSARTAGFVLMPVGGATMGVGAAVLVYGFMKKLATSYGCDADCDLPTWIWPGGAIAMGAGMVVGVTGLVLWTTNRQAGVDVKPLEPPQASRTHLQLQPAVGPRWTGLALTGSF